MVTDGALVDVDLATDAMRAIPTAEHTSIDRLVALDDTLIGLSSDGAHAISPTDGTFRTVIDGFVSYGGDDGRSLLVGVSSAGGDPTLKLIPAEGPPIDVHPSVMRQGFSLSSPIHDGEIVIEAGQGVGLIDPTTGDGRLVAEGGLIAVGHGLLIRTICRPDLRCEWVIGDVAGGASRSIDAPLDLPSAIALGQLSADGATLVGLTFGAGAPIIQAIDLTTGIVRPVDDPPDLDTIFEHGLIFTPDGRWLVTLGPAGDIELISLHSPARHTIELGLPGTIDAFTARS